MSDDAREAATGTVTAAEPAPMPASGAPDESAVVLPPMFEVATHARRARIPAAVFALVVLAVASVLGHWLIGVGACLGVGLGNANSQLLQSSMVRFTAGAIGSDVGSSKPQRKQFVVGGFARLGLITLAVIVLVAFVRELGWGLLIGLAGFQLILLGFSGLAMYKQLRGEIEA